MSEVKTFGEDKLLRLLKFLIDSQDLNTDELVAAQLAEGLASYGIYEIRKKR